MPKSPKDRAWDATSKYIRTKECLETTGLWFVGVCCTCKRRFHINVLDAGHYISGRRNSVLFVPENIHIQCRIWCNQIKHGNSTLYKKYIIERYGEEKEQWLQSLKHKTIQNKNMDFEAIEADAKKKLKELEIKHKFYVGEQI